jgi:hypothetical protein
VEAVVVTTLEQLPKNATHWSRTLMAEHSGLSKSTVGRIWRKFQLKPHLTDTLQAVDGPLFVEKVYDVVGLYFNPPDGAVVLSMDENWDIAAGPRRLRSGSMILLSDPKVINIPVQDCGEPLAEIASVPVIVLDPGNETRQGPTAGSGSACSSVCARHRRCFPTASGSSS